MSDDVDVASVYSRARSLEVKTNLFVTKVNPYLPSFHFKNGVIEIRIKAKSVFSLSTRQSTDTGVLGTK